jgi:hypothetical protein
MAITSELSFIPSWRLLTYNVLVFIVSLNEMGTRLLRFSSTIAQFSRNNRSFVQVEYTVVIHVYDMQCPPPPHWGKM